MRFKPQFGDTQISSIQLKENASETLSVEIDTPARAEAAESPVTIRARAGAFEAAATVKVSLKGTQDLKMGSAAGTLNTSLTAGKKTPVDFLVGNAGTAPIRNLSFLSKKPNDKWTVEFRPDKIDALNSGEVKEIKMEILAPDRTIAGDYLLTLTANAPEVNKSVEFRVTVSTPTVWGWIGFGIVAFGGFGTGCGILPVRTQMSAVVETQNLTKRYHDKLAVNALNLTVQEGEIFGFLGPNGAGKTTTILMLLGLTEATSGRASVCGFDPTRESLEVKRRVGYLPENPGFYEDMSAGENLLYMARLNRIPDDEARRDGLQKS